MNLKEILKTVDLTQQEATVYLSLVELQDAKVGEISTKSSIATSNIYEVLNSLVKKGLISYRLQNNVKFFHATPVERLDGLFLEKQKKLDEQRRQVSDLISNLKKIEQDKSSITNYKYFEGLSGVISMWYEIIRDMEKNSGSIILTSKLDYKKMIEYYDLFAKARVEKNIAAKMIFPYEKRELAKKRSKQLAEVRFYELENEAEMGVVGDLVFIWYVVHENPRSFLVKDKVIASAFTFALEQIWKGAKS